MDDTWLALVSVIGSTIRLATPLILAGLAGLYAERSGVVDVGLEGKMLAAAFAAAAAAYVVRDPWVGLAAGIGASVLFALVHGYACITKHGNQVVSGMAINILVAGLAPTLGFAWFGEGGDTPALPTAARFASIKLPFHDALADVPFVGPLYTQAISGHNLLVYFTAVAVPLTAWVLFHTRFGLRLRAVGESPSAVDTAGISVAGLRYMAMMVSGLLCGMAGAYLSTAQGAGFVRDMTAGKGFLALAALIFGKWMPGPTLFACLLFALTDAIQTRLQGQPIPGIGVVVPVQFIQMLPYVLTVLLLAGFVGKATAPRASGIPYVKER